MKKSKVIILSSFLIIITIIGYFIYSNSREYESEWYELIEDVEYENVENYEIIEILEEKKIVNKNMGLSFLIPDEWSVEMLNDDNEIEIMSPGLESEASYPPSEGCIIRSGIAHFDQKIEKEKMKPQIIKNIMENKDDLIDNTQTTQEIIEIDSRQTLKTINRNNELGKIVLTETPINNTIYHFGIIFRPDYEHECLKIFDGFLASIVID